MKDCDRLRRELHECQKIFPFKKRLEQDPYHRGLTDAYHHLSYSTHTFKKWWEFWK